jgi:hypothetical protein
MSAIATLVWQRVSAFFVAVIATPLGAGAVVAAAFIIWNGWIDNPRVEREATASCVARAETAALQAQLAEERRRRAAATAALELYRRQADADAAAAEARAAELQKEIADYEKKLADAGRGCRLDDADLRWLHDNGRASSGRR